MTLYTVLLDIRNWRTHSCLTDPDKFHKLGLYYNSKIHVSQIRTYSTNTDCTITQRFMSDEQGLVPHAKTVLQFKDSCLS